MSTTSEIRIRLSPAMKERLVRMAEASGHLNMSDFARTRIFDEISTHQKLDKIIHLIEEAIEEGESQTEDQKVQVDQGYK